MTLIIALAGAIGALGTFLIVALDRWDKTRLAINLSVNSPSKDHGYFYVLARVHPRSIHTTISVVEVEDALIAPVISTNQDSWTGQQNQLPDIHHASPSLVIDEELLPATAATGPLNLEFFIRANASSSDKVKISFLTTEKWALKRHTCHAKISRSQA